MSDPCAGKLQPNPRALAIMDAARMCFERHGFHAASMAAIAAQACMSVGHIYRYFENKDAVVAAIVAQDLEEISRDVGSLTGGPEEMAGQILQQVSNDRAGRRMILWLEVRAEGARNPKIAAMIHRAEGSIRRDVRQAVLSSWKRSDLGAAASESEIDVRVSLVGVLIEGLQMSAFRESGAVNMHLMEYVREILAHILAPGPIFTGSAGDSSCIEAASASSRAARRLPTSPREPPLQSRR